MRTYTTQEAIELLKRGKKIKFYYRIPMHFCHKEAFEYGYYCMGADGLIIDAYNRVWYDDLNDFQHWRRWSEWIEHIEPEDTFEEYVEYT